MVGVMCYASKDLLNWRNCGVALSVTEPAEGRGNGRAARGRATTDSDIERGCILERPKIQTEVFFDLVKSVIKRIPVDK